ncbi:hypothetical protein [Paraglaciecola sp. 2405UD69-4]|uniref:hypothetical protein n=1 Tax=Paraglaciecola sp. 2405UD69-4 TaxID=3391836 RepID=UPI0039C8F3AF
MNKLLWLYFLFASFNVLANSANTENDQQGLGTSSIENSFTTKSGWELVAGKDSQKATIKYATKGVSVKIAAPVNSKEEKTLIYNSTDAFVGATSIALAYRYSNAEINSELTEMIDLCQKYPSLFTFDDHNTQSEYSKELKTYITLLNEDDPNSVLIISNLLKMSDELETNSQENLAKSLREIAKEISRNNPPYQVIINKLNSMSTTPFDFEEICSGKDVQVLTAAFKEDDAKNHAKADEILKKFAASKLGITKPFWIYGGAIEYGRQDYEWFDPQVEIIAVDPDNYNPLLKAKSDEEPISIEANASWVVPGKLQITGSLELERAYEAAGSNKAQTRCAQSTSELFNECVSALQSMPEKTYNRNIGLNVIWPIQLSFLGIKKEIVLSPTFTFDASESDRSWKVPLFIFGDKKSVLNAGITYEYDSSDNGDEFFGLFLGGSL